jgi:hypothetical protein
VSGITEFYILLSHSLPNTPHYRVSCHYFHSKARCHQRKVAKQAPEIPPKKAEKKPPGGPVSGGGPSCCSRKDAGAQENPLLSFPTCISSLVVGLHVAIK